jgi:RNA polymerase sigma-70 factor (ECF subfamily)
VRRFATACDTGDIAALEAILAADSVAVCDGGGKVRAPLYPIRGAHEVARFVTTLLTGAVLTVESVNGCAGLALRQGGHAVAVISVSTAGAEITAVWIVLNPDKLRGWHHR